MPRGEMLEYDKPVVKLCWVVNNNLMNRMLPLSVSDVTIDASPVSKRHFGSSLLTSVARLQSEQSVSNEEPKI